MPNNCSSILKKISYIFFLFFIVSCASLNNDIKSTPFAGKLLINQNNVEQFSFNININVAKNTSIIQLKKPFYGLNDATRNSAYGRDGIGFCDKTGHNTSPDWHGYRDRREYRIIIASDSPRRQPLV